MVEHHQTHIANNHQKTMVTNHQQTLSKIIKNTLSTIIKKLQKLKTLVSQAWLWNNLLLYVGIRRCINSSGQRPKGV
jgi:hypothetical protein